MHYTKTYRLPQWEKSDRIMMEDFNAAMAGIESGIEKTDRDAAGYAAQVQANAAALAGKAQAAADAAMDTAQAAQQTADNAYCPGNVPYTVGSYAGNGTEVLIDLGYQPRLIIITGQELAGEVNFVRGIIVAVPGMLPFAVSFKKNGFSVKNPDGIYTPKLNISGESYGYIAFR